MRASTWRREKLSNGFRARLQRPATSPHSAFSQIVGRVFAADDDKPDHARVVIISERLWRARLHSDRAIAGQALRINGLPYTIVGIMPKTFDPLLSKSNIWVPAAFTPAQLADYDDHYLSVMGRLQPSVILTQSELNVIALRLQQRHPIDDKERGFRVIALTPALVGDQRSVLRMMLGAVGFVLLIACANIANLQLARARGRQKEIAVRASLGASPQRIVRQLLAESLVLGLASAIVGVSFAFWGVSWIVVNGPGGVPRLDQASVDANSLVFAGAVALFSSLLFGVAPALRSASTRLSEVFKESAGRSTGIEFEVFSSGEFALALMLMAGAELLIRSAVLVPVSE
jgi:putative ABC transport system permease protein